MKMNAELYRAILQAETANLPPRLRARFEEPRLESVVAAVLVFCRALGSDAFFLRGDNGGNPRVL